MYIHSGSPRDWGDLAQDQLKRGADDMAGLRRKFDAGGTW